MVDAYALTLAATLLTAGVLADRHGRRAVFAVGLAVFTARSALCALAGSARSSAGCSSTASGGAGCSS